jgi:hypothetical protein
MNRISQHPGARRDPTDPISGILLGVYDTVGEISLGLVAGPVELGRQATPVLRRYESSQRENPNGNTQPLTGRELLGAPQAAGKVALETGKGLGRIVTASLKTPMVVLNGVTRGFHNLPKAYGEEVRVYENVTGVKSGMKVGAKVCSRAMLLLLRANGGIELCLWLGRRIARRLYETSPGRAAQWCAGRCHWIRKGSRKSVV